jgi:cysteine-rich repeat protein
MYHKGFENRKQIVAGAVGVAVLLLGAGGAQAALTAAQKCHSAIIKASRLYEDTRINALDKCEQDNLKGKNDPPLDCPTGDPVADGKIVKALAKLESTIAKACCGADKTCGNADDQVLADIGWAGLANRCAGGSRDGDECSSAADCPSGACSPADFCPSLENDSACDSIAIADPGDIADCLACTGDLATGESIALSYDSLKAKGSNKPAELCKREAQRATLFYRKTRNLLRVCADKVAKGAIVGPCPDTTTAAKIQNEQSKLLAAVAKKCGGADKAFGGGDDLALDLFGAPVSCPGLDAPGAAPNCSQPLSTVQDWAECLVCVNGYQVACTNDLASRNLPSYAAECNADCGNGKIDAGESCDDGNVVDGDGCPATCAIGACTPTGGTATVNVNYTTPEDIAGVTVYIEYPESEVRIPGQGNQQSVQDRIFLATGDFFNPNDLNYALQLVQIDSSSLPFVGTQLLQIQFDTCTGVSLGGGDFSCRVLSASSPSSAEVAGATCTVEVP